MKTKNIKDVKPVKFTGGKSYRTVLMQDNFGFALMQTMIDKGGPYKWHYKYHKEVCHCVKGKGALKNILTNDVFEILEGVTYMLDKNEPHEFTAFTDVVLISVFNPPLVGDEKHDKNGVYEKPNRTTYLNDIYNAINNTTCKLDAIQLLDTIL